MVDREVGTQKNETYRANMPLFHALSIDDGWLCNQTNQGLDDSNIVEQGSIIVGLNPRLSTTVATTKNRLRFCKCRKKLVREAVINS